VRRVVLRNISLRLGRVLRYHSRLVYFQMTIATLVRSAIRYPQFMFMTFTLLAGCLALLHTGPLFAAEVDELETLMELDLRDWSNISPEGVITRCTLALSSGKKLNEEQICRLYVLRAVALNLQGKPRESIRDLTEVLKINPNEWHALRIRGETFTSLRDYEKGQADFQSLLKLQPESGVAHAFLAICLSQCGHKTACVEQAEKAVSLDPDEPLGYMARADAYLQGNHYQKGLKDLNQCITLSLGDGKPIAARPFLMRAAVYLNFFDNTKKALPDLLMARRLDPSDDMVKGMFCEYYFKSGKYHMAFNLSGELTTGPAMRPDLRGRRVVCLLEHKQQNRALQVAESMINQDPMRWANYVYRGEVLFSQNNFKGALQDFDKSLSLRQDNLIAMAAKAYLLATCPDAQCRGGSAARALATKCCERTDYQVPRQLMLLGMACAECGDYKEAVRWAKRSIEKADSSFPFLDDYRQRLALFEKGKPYRFSPESRVFDYLFP
jgi:tetratricopeptide (TPR) repeat protein